MNERNHSILVIRTHPSGAEEWFCPTCGRKFLVQWSPEYQCVVIDPGDVSAIHNMSRGALVVEERVDAFSDDERLQPWADWLNGVDLESWLGAR